MSDALATQAPSRQQLATLIADGLRPFLAPGQVFEVRILGYQNSQGYVVDTHSGYFDDVEKAARAIVPFDGRAKGIYFIPDEIDRSLLSRAANRIKACKKGDPTTADGDVTRRRFFKLDADPERASGISATDAEKAAAHERMGAIIGWLTSQSWARPAYADSGNGAHALYAIDLPNTPEVNNTIDRCLKALQQEFGVADVVKVDTTVSNAARIWKVYGTMACKGDNTPERPHRRAQLIDVPEQLETVTLAQLEALAALLKEDKKDPKQGKTTPAAKGKGKEAKALDVEQWLDSHQIGHGEKKPWNDGGTIWKLDKCHFSDAHTDGAWIAQFASGAIAAGCHHDSCQGKDWAALREMFDGPRKVELTVSQTIEGFAAELGTFALCDLDDRLFLNKKPAADADIAPLEIMVHDHNGACKYGDMNLPIGAIKPVVLTLAARNRFHPVRDWLNSLQWDGKGHVHALASYFDDAHDLIDYGNGAQGTIFEAMLSRWLIGAVRRAFEATQNPVLVLAGAQGLGKSYLPAWLAHPLGVASEYNSADANPYFCEGAINPESIDHQRRLTNKFIWEIGEVGGTMRRADQDALKQFITQSEATFRVPYGKFDLTKPALCSWIATVNPSTGFLSDPTGNRRFRTVEVIAIEWAYSRNIDAAQVWAQAVNWYRQGLTSDLSAAEQTAVEDINGNHEVTDDETEAIMRLYEFYKDVKPAANEKAADSPEWSVYTADVANYLAATVSTCKNTNVTRVGRALAKLTGTPSKRLKTSKKYPEFDGRSGFHGLRARR